jgi:hypothetical protein
MPEVDELVRKSKVVGILLIEAEEKNAGSG